MLGSGSGPGEKGVSGVPGPPVLVVPAEVRCMMRVVALVLMGAMMLEEPEASDDLDCEPEREGCGCWSLGALGALSLLENKPMSGSGRVIGSRSLWVAA